MKISRKYKERAAYYQKLASAHASNLDFSEEALKKCFSWESSGSCSPGLRNGYMVGKKLFDLQVKSWKEDLLKKLLTAKELHDDPDLPSWVKRLV